MKTAKKVISLALTYFMLISSMFVSVQALAAEPTNIHTIDFENFGIASYSDQASAKAALTSFEDIGAFSGKANYEIASDASYGNIFKISKISNTGQLYAGEGCFYIAAINGNGTKVSKSTGKLVLEFDYQLGHGTHWLSGLYITPYPVSGKDAFSSITLQRNNTQVTTEPTYMIVKDTNWHHWKMVLDLDAKTYSVDLDSKSNVLSGNVTFPTDALEANISSYKIGVDINTSYVAFDNLKTYYIAPPTAEELAELASIKAHTSQTVGGTISITPSYETANLESAALYFGETLITASASNGVPVSYVLPESVTPGTYNIQLKLTYTGLGEAVKTVPVVVKAKGEAINEHLIDFESYPIAEYKTYTEANAALAPVSGFIANMNGKVTCGIKDSTDVNDGHGKVFALTEVDGNDNAINLDQIYFNIPANVEAGAVVAKTTGKVVLEFDWKFKYNWKYGLRITPVSSGNKEGSYVDVINSDQTINIPGINDSNDEEWNHVKLIYDLDKKTYSGQVASTTIAETAFTLNADEPNLAYFNIDTSMSSADTNYVHFDNFATSYIPPVENVLEITNNKAKAIFETNGSVSEGSVCYIASYLAGELVAIALTPLSPSPVAAVFETEEITLPASYDVVKCIVIDPSGTPLIKVIAK